MSCGAQTEKNDTSGMTFIIRQILRRPRRRPMAELWSQTTAACRRQARRAHGEQTMQRKGIDFLGSDSIAVLYSFRAWEISPAATRCNALQRIISSSYTISSSKTSRKHTGEGQADCETLRNSRRCIRSRRVVLPNAGGINNSQLCSGKAEHSTIVEIGRDLSWLQVAAILSG
jgi:hypothetical protein